MARLYVISKGSVSKKTQKPASQVWKELLLMSCLLNVLQYIFYIITHKH